MSIYNANRHAWSGLFSGGNYNWQEGLRNVCREVGDFQFHSSNSGYAGWENVADAAIARNAPGLLLMGHSNGGYAITSIARKVSSVGIPCWLICWDRTLKACPTLGSNVNKALDIWAGLKKLVPGPEFQGELKLYAFPKETHTGVIKNEKAQLLAVNFGSKFAEQYPE